MLLGLTPAEWTAAGTIALTLVGVGSIVITTIQTIASRKAAQSAEIAAEAAKQSVTVAEAGLDIRFEAEYVELPSGRYIRIFNRGARIFLHGAVVSSGYFMPAGDDIPALIEDLSLETVGDRTFPYRAHQDETLTFKAPFGPVELQHTFVVWLIVMYSLSREGATEVRGVKTKLDPEMLPTDSRKGGEVW